MSGEPDWSTHGPRLAEALERLLSLPAAADALKYLDAGIGTATPQAAWLRARAALAALKEDQDERD